MSDSTVRRGQRIDRKTAIPIQYTEQEQEYVHSDALLGTAGVTITPKDAAQAQVVTETTPTTALNAYYISLAGTVDIPDMPNVLTGIVVTFNTSALTAEDVQDEPLIRVVGNNGSFSLSSNANAQAGASCIPDIQPEIKQYPSRDIPCTNLFFFLSGNVTKAQIIARAAAILSDTVTAWPLFRPVSHTLTAKGQQVSVRANANSNQSESYNSSGEYTIQITPGNDPTNILGAGATTGQRADGYSKESSLSNRTFVISPTIHGAISISVSEMTATATVTVNANQRAFTGTSPAISVPAITNEPSPRTETATGSITPTSLTATSPSAIPTTGLYLVKYNVEPYDFGYNYVSAVIIDAAQFA